MINYSLFTLHCSYLWYDRVLIYSTKHDIKTKCNNIEVSNLTLGQMTEKRTIMIIKKTLELPSDRKFGLFFSFIFLSVSLYFLFLSQTLLFLLLIGLSCILLFVSIIKPTYLSKYNKAWMYFGRVLGKVVSPIVLLLIYLIFFIPIGLYFKLVGRDELRLKNTNYASYWKERNYNNSEMDSFKNQF